MRSGNRRRRAVRRVVGDPVPGADRVCELRRVRSDGGQGSKRFRSGTTAQARIGGAAGWPQSWWERRPFPAHVGREAPFRGPIERGSAPGRWRTRAVCGRQARWGRGSRSRVQGQFGQPTRRGQALVQQYWRAAVGGFVRLSVHGRGGAPDKDGWAEFRWVPADQRPQRWAEGLWPLLGHRPPGLSESPGFRSW